MTIFKNPLKTMFSIRNKLLQFVLGVWIVDGYFLFEKETFNGLLKVIGIQNVIICGLAGKK